MSLKLECYPHKHTRWNAKVSPNRPPDIVYRGIEIIELQSMNEITSCYRTLTRAALTGLLNIDVKKGKKRSKARIKKHVNTNSQSFRLGSRVVLDS